MNITEKECKRWKEENEKRKLYNVKIGTLAEALIEAMDNAKVSLIYMKALRDKGLPFGSGISVGDLASIKAHIADLEAMLAQWKGEGGK